MLAHPARRSDGRAAAGGCRRMRDEARWGCIGANLTVATPDAGRGEEERA